jgi:hypothetical protein
MPNDPVTPPPGFTLAVPSSGVRPPAGFTLTSGSSAPAATPPPTSAGPSFFGGVLRGANDVLAGLGQTASHLGMSADVGAGPGMVGGPGPSPTTTADIDKAVQARAQKLSAEGYDHSAGRTVGNVAGDIAITLPFMGEGAAVTLPRAFLRGLAQGGIGGAAAGAAQPVTSGNYAATKAGQVALGAAGGAVAGGALGSLAHGLASDSPEAVDAFIGDTYSRVVKPSIAGRTSAAKLDRGAAQARLAIDSVVANRANLQLTDDAGNELAGQLPKSLKQFADAIEQTKAGVFAKYDAMARQAGDKGVTVDLAPAVAELRSIASERAVRDLHPQLAAYANDLADRLAASGKYSPSETQAAIQNLNKSVGSFFANPTAETVARSGIEARLLGKLREGLDSAIESAGSKGYQALRSEYGALRETEKAVAKAVARTAKNVPGGPVGRLGISALSARGCTGSRRAMSTPCSPRSQRVPQPNSCATWPHRTAPSLSFSRPQNSRRPAL